MLKKKKMYEIGRIQSKDYHIYDRLGVIVQSSDDIRHLLIDFSEQYNPKLPSNFNQLYDEQLAAVIDQLKQAYAQLSDLWNAQLKDKFEVLKTKDDQDHAEYSAAVSTVYNESIRHTINQVNAALHDWSKTMKSPDILQNSHVSHIRKVRWRTVPQICEQLKYYIKILQSEQTKELITKNQLDSVITYILKHPDNFAKFVQNHSDRYAGAEVVLADGPAQAINVELAADGIHVKAASND